MTRFSVVHPDSVVDCCGGRGAGLYGETGELYEAKRKRGVSREGSVRDGIWVRGWERSRERPFNWHEVQVYGILESPILSPGEKAERERMLSPEVVWGSHPVPSFGILTIMPQCLQ